MKAVILAGGKGTRLAPYTYILPKPMMPVGDHAILEVLLKQLSHSGVKDIVLTVGHLAHLMQAYFKNGEQYGLNISYSVESEPLGTAGPLTLVDSLDETFLVCNGDVLTLLDVNDLIQFHRENGAVCTIASHLRTHKINLGVLEYDGLPNQVAKYIEKPTLDFKVSMGIYVFEPEVMQYIPKGKYYDFPTLVQDLLEADELVMSYPYDGYWRDLGDHEDYLAAVEDFEIMRAQFLREE
jgi:NDP-sugar pyrophosphorylase family protein